MIWFCDISVSFEVGDESKRWRLVWGTKAAGKARREQSGIATYPTVSRYKPDTCRSVRAAAIGKEGSQREGSSREAIAKRRGRQAEVAGGQAGKNRRHAEGEVAGNEESRHEPCPLMRLGQRNQAAQRSAESRAESGAGQQGSE